MHSSEYWKSNGKVWESFVCSNNDRMREKGIHEKRNNEKRFDYARASHTKRKRVQNRKMIACGGAPLATRQS